jgi:hypothetical protein
MKLVVVLIYYMLRGFKSHLPHEILKLYLWDLLNSVIIFRSASLYSDL